MGGSAAGGVGVRLPGASAGDSVGRLEPGLVRKLRRSIAGAAVK